MTPPDAKQVIPLRSERWTKLVRAVHARRRQLDLDEDRYRDAIERATGKRSCSDLGTVGLGAVLIELGKLRPSSVLPDAPGASKLRALWIAGWHLGVVQDRRDSALAAFVRRECGVDAAGWATARDLGKAIDRLKAWLRREAGVKWPQRDRTNRERGRGEAMAVLEAQHRALGLDPPALTTIETVNLVIAALGQAVRDLKSGHEDRG
ncbi:MAG: regulatory protein GemA [Deltaproteobacteria bacterium]|nr:regulatory protein GemA [Deltaproteobacteria bacterium]